MTMIVLGLGLALATIVAAPPDGGVTLHWTAPPGCPDAQAVRDEAARRSRGDDRPVDAVGIVRAEQGAWVLELTLRGSTVEQRTIRASSCTALAEAAGLLIAVAADPTLAPEQGEPVVPAVAIETPKPVPEPVPEATPPSPIATPPVTPDPDPPPRRRSRARATIRIDAVGQFLRVLPAVAGFGVGGAIGVMWPHARAELRGHWYLPSDATEASAPRAGGRIDLWTIAPAGCWVPTWRRGSLALPLCGGVELGGMRGRSIGVDESGGATALFLSITADATLVYSPIPRLGLRLGPQVAILARRPAFNLRDREPLFAAGPAALRLVAGIELRLP